MDKDGQFWIGEPPEASADEWAYASERVGDLIRKLYDDHGNLIRAKDGMLVFALGEALRRCSSEAESREPGIFERRAEARRHPPR